MVQGANKLGRVQTHFKFHKRTHSPGGEIKVSWRIGKDSMEEKLLGMDFSEWTGIQQGEDTTTAQTPSISHTPFGVGSPNLGH